MLNTHNRVKYRSKKTKTTFFLITHYKNKLLKEWVWCSHKGLQQSFTYLLLCLMTWIHNTTQCVRLTIKLPHLVGHFICNRLHRPKIKTWRPAQKYVTNVNSAKVLFSKWSNTSAGLELNDEGRGGQRLRFEKECSYSLCHHPLQPEIKHVSKSYPWNRERYITSSHTYTAHHTLVHGYTHVPSS